MSPGRHFEIIISGRQLAGLIALVAALVLLAFGLGVGVRALEPRQGRGEVAEGPVLLPPGGVTTPRDSALIAGGAAPSGPTAAPASAVTVAPPALPADILAATPLAIASTEPTPGLRPQAPGPGSPQQVPAPTARPPRPTPTARPKPTPTPHTRSWVQVASLGRSDQAEGVRQRVMALGFGAEQVHVLAGTGGKYRVRLGPFPDQESASRVTARLQASGFPDAFTLRE